MTSIYQIRKPPEINMRIMPIYCKLILVKFRIKAKAKWILMIGVTLKLPTIK